MARDSMVSTEIENGVTRITVEGFPPIVIDPAEMPDSLNAYAACHGYKQRAVDAAALPVVDGIRPTAAMKHAAIVRVVDNMKATGEWRLNGAAGDGTGSDGLLVRALAEVAGMTIEDARTAVAGWDKKFQAAMRADPQIAPVIARMRTAKAPKVDTASALAALMRR